MLMNEKSICQYLMGRQWLYGAFALARRLTNPIPEQTGGFEHPVHRRGTDCGVPTTIERPRGTPAKNGAAEFF
jgi:hypothetical protein